MFEIDGDYYYAKKTGELVVDCEYYCTYTIDGLPKGIYRFDAQGRIIFETPTVKEGIVAEDGSLFYYENGARVYAGLIYLDGAYYYVKSNGEVVHDRDYWLSKIVVGEHLPEDKVLPKATYSFASDGKLILPEPEVKNGIVAENGSLYYYVDGVRTSAGLIKIGDDFYYVKYGGEVIHDRDYWISNVGEFTDFPKGTYHFDSEGRMADVPASYLPEPPEPQLKNGIVEENGTLYYYEDDVRTYAGLIKIDGYYYYVKYGGVVICGRDYWVSKLDNCPGFPKGTYHFGDDGKMLDPPAGY